MPIPGPGTAISINTIATEFGGTVPHSLSEYYRGGGLVPNTPVNSAIPTSGQIALGNFYGSANRVSISLVISSNSYTYDVYTNRGPTYVSGSSDVTVTVNPGVTVGATGTGAYAMLVPSSFSPGDTITIVNNGVIQGAGGSGGGGGSYSGTSGPFNPADPPPTTLATNGNSGGTGGSALYVNRPVTVTNNGTIAAGGGGGGGGGSAIGRGGPIKNSEFFGLGGSGGGGGAGFTPPGDGGPGGTGGAMPPWPGLPAPSSYTSAGNSGNAGTSPAGGTGGATVTAPPTHPNGPWQAFSSGGAGGTGGGRGAGGSSGTPGQAPQPQPFGTNSSSGGGGGPTGNYIVGNPFVTWPATGTRQGNVA